MSVDLVEANDFSFVNGFFEAEYVTNSPRLILDSFIAVPSIFHDGERQLVEMDNEIMKGELFYKEQEPGLWGFLGCYQFKASVNFKSVNIPDIPSNYYTLAFEDVEGDNGRNVVLIDGVPYSKNSWVLYKPKTRSIRSHFQKSIERSLGIFFSEDWILEYLNKNSNSSSSILEQFIDSKSKIFVWPDNGLRLNDLLNISIASTNFLEADKLVQLSKYETKLEHVIQLFQNQVREQASSINFFATSDRNRGSVLRAKDILEQAINKSFPGVTQIAHIVGVSPTRLKSDFKKVFGQTLFNYFRRIQMQAVLQLIQKQNYTVKELATLFEFSNPAKLSACFEKHIGTKLTTSKND